MGKTIALCSQKGGVAKTTTTALMAYGLYHRGFEVLLVDMDPRRNLSKWLKAELNERPTTFELLMGTVKADEVIQELPFFDIMPASKELAQAEIALPLTGKLKRLRKAIAGIKSRYDYIVIDTGPSLNVLTLNALIAADEVIVPSNAAAFSIEGFLDLYQTISDIKEDENPELVVRGVLITMYTPRATVSKELAKTIQNINDKFGVNTFDTRIRSSVAVIQSQTYRFDLFDTLPTNIVSIDFNAFLDEYLGGSDDE